MTIRIFTFLLGFLGLAAVTSKVLEGTLHADQAHTSYYSNGQAKESTHFTEGMRNGLTIRWYADGTLKAEGEFEGGRMTGEWTWKTPEGEIDSARSGLYEDGIRVSG
jgi:antitoxin component YwqK of YwqJK toxin-antitoxin module